MPKKYYLGKEQRKYIRLDSVFPVEFRFIAPDNSALSGWLQGFTGNISKCGICLEVNRLEPECAELLKENHVRIQLQVELPVSGQSVAAVAVVAWSRHAGNKYFIGLSYEAIDQRMNNKILRYARAKKLILPVLLSCLLLLGAAYGVNTFINLRLTKSNRDLVNQLVGLTQEAYSANQKVQEISRQEEDLRLEIQGFGFRIQQLEEEKKNARELKSGQLENLNSALTKLSQEKRTLEARLIGLESKGKAINEGLLRLDQRKNILQKDNLDKMYAWLKVHQNPRSGLVMSFEGDSDIQNWAFTYDQSLAAQAFTYFGDLSRAKKILEFFKDRAERKNGLFFNAYYVNDASCAEYVAHSGPNIWLGIAILQYTQKSSDSSYLGLAEEIAAAIMSLQDVEGGLRGGPAVSWYSTEHNLDAYAFFNMLYKLTTKEIYQEARDKILAWILAHTYSREDIPIKRGRGDSTIATDTYAWSIAALGPEKLEEIGMSPDRIMEFVESNCAVEASYIRPEGRSVKIRGFDFAPERHVARGGVVSSEWTAQMVLAFRIMADFYTQKHMPDESRAYQLKADTYLAELGNMVISSPSPSGQGESCMPYATESHVDTGHGWMTPKGKNTGSVAGTVYTIFAYYKYNPLELK